MMSITVTQILRYPVKGLSAQALPSVTLAPGRGLPEDRRFAIMHGASVFNPNEPEWQPKTSFVVLARHDRLGTLETEYDAATTALTIRRGGRQVARGQIGTALGRGLVDQFLAAYFKGDVPGAPRLVEAPGIAFTNTREAFVSVVNAASVRDIERVVKEPVNPLRFRPNLLIEGAAPWQEAAWIGGYLEIGPVRLEIVKPIERDNAINIEPGVGAQPLNLLLALERGYGHRHCGVYARVVSGGPIAPGDAVTVVPAAAG